MKSKKVLEEGPSQQPPIYMFSLSPELDKNGEPVAFAMIRITPEIEMAMSAAYEDLSSGVPGSIEIPISAPLAMARCLKHLDRSNIQHAKALECYLTMLTLEDAKGWYKLGVKLAEVFAHFAKAPTKPNADIVISRYQAPRLRTRLRGGRHRYTSMPAQPLEPSHWNTKVKPGLRPLYAIG